MAREDFGACFANRRLLLTEAAVGLRLEREFGISPDPDVYYAGLIYDGRARRALATLYRQYIGIAREFGLPILLMTNTRRANRERVSRSAFRNCDIMGDWVRFLRDVASDYECAYVGGMLGCKNDAYTGEGALDAAEAEAFHAWQAAEFGRERPDFLIEGIMPNAQEAIGLSRAAGQLELPYIVSLMVRRDGRLPDGNTLHGAIDLIDGATSRKPLCYMSNCVHPNVLRSALSLEQNRTESVRRRYMGLQANAADLDPNALDRSAALRTSSPEELAGRFAALCREFPLRICGGCCGTADRHLREIARRLTELIDMGDGK